MYRKNSLISTISCFIYTQIDSVQFLNLALKDINRLEKMLAMAKILFSILESKVMKSKYFNWSFFTRNLKTYIVSSLKYLKLFISLTLDTTSRHLNWMNNDESEFMALKLYQAFSKRSFWKFISVKYIFSLSGFFSFRVSINLFLWKTFRINQID